MNDPKYKFCAEDKIYHRAGVGCSQKHHGGSERLIDKALVLLDELGV